MEGGETDTEQVMSEIHLGCPPGCSGPYASRFSFVLPPGYELRTGDDLHDKIDLVNQKISLDEDGDLILPRRNGIEASDDGNTMIIQHYITSTIPNVGLQVWRAELVLSDFLLHKMLFSSEFHGMVALDLGAGSEQPMSWVVSLCPPSLTCRLILVASGLAGLLLAHTARTVFLTDIGNEILENCAKNVANNSGIFGSRAVIRVRELDWTLSWPPKYNGGASSPQNKYSWTMSEVEEAQNASLLVAADVVYNDDLTAAFFSVLESLMSKGSEKVLYLALEKRYNFTLDDFDVVANGYSYFRSYLKEKHKHNCSESGISRHFSGKCIDIAELPQYFRDYDRETNVELWQINYDRRHCENDGKLPL